MTKGCFITIEGVEGVGKSTNVAVVESVLSEQAIEFISTREPGGTVLGEKIRDLLLDKNETSMTDMTETLLMFAARAQHVSQIIKPALNRGNWVVCDRFTDSTYAYQGGGRGMGVELVSDLEHAILGDFEPDLTILLDIPAEVGLSRAGKRGDLDRFENEDIEFFNRVREGFLDRARRLERFRIIDANRPLEEVQNNVEAEIKKVINEWQT